VKLEFFEGPAGTGKTHNLMARAAELLDAGILGEHHRVLALTFMNGARRRLQTRLSENRAFRRRFVSQTFDSFAITLASRRRSLLAGNVGLHEKASSFGPFDGPCFLASRLLEVPAVHRWVGASFPLIVVDEAQDLNEYRADILRGLAQSSYVLAAADGFQCLEEARDTRPILDWLRGAGKAVSLTRVERTSQAGLLLAAHAVRNGTDIRAALTQSKKSRNPTWLASGFRLTETPATNRGIVAWTIASEIARLKGGNAVIVTPDARSTLVRDAIEKVRSQSWEKGGFGPFAVTWEGDDGEEIQALLERLDMPDTGNHAEFHAVLSPQGGKPVIAQVLSRIDRIRRLYREKVFTSAEVREFVSEAVRNQSRFALRRIRGNLAMTIQRAKNREFENVIVLWPHTVQSSSPDYQRRLLYNAITRAVRQCSVVVFGKDRISSSPFAKACSAEGLSE
jgi:superfamily I DNA/RNA helicase